MASAIDIENVDTWPLGQFTCRVDGCENFRTPILLRVPEPPEQHQVTCGACGTEIYDKVAV